MSASILTAINLKKKYGHKIVFENLNFTICENELVLIKGPNGSGKTTLLNILAKYDNVWEGVLNFKNIDLKKLKLHKYPISYIPDEPIFFEGLTVKEHLIYTASMFGYKRDEIRELLETYVNLFNLKDYLNYIPSQLSKGNRQKVMICCSLLKKFDILIADEPFSFLDADSAKTLVEIFSILKENGKTIILSSHETEYFKNLIDRILELKRGA